MFIHRPICIVWNRPRLQQNSCPLHRMSHRIASNARMKHQMVHLMIPIHGYISHNSQSQWVYSIYILSSTIFIIYEYIWCSRVPWLMMEEKWIFCSVYRVENDILVQYFAYYNIQLYWNILNSHFSMCNAMTFKLLHQLLVGSCKMAWKKELDETYCQQCCIRGLGTI